MSRALKTVYWVVICMTNIVSLLSFAADEINVQNQEVHKFQYQGTKQMGLVQYRIYPTTEKNKSTVLFLCGGPGFACSLFQPKYANDDYEVITVDYLGVGDNSHWSSEEDMEIESQGKMVAELIRQLNRSSLIIHATSYGTTVGTVATSKLDNENRVLCLILEGVVGPKSLTDYASGYKDVARKVWESLSIEQQSKFQMFYKNITTDMTKNEQADLNIYLTSLFMGGKANAANIFQYLNDNSRQTLDASLRFNKSFSQIHLGKNIHHLQTNFCQIHNSPQSEPTDDKMMGGLLPITIGLPTSLCQNKINSAPWNPKNYSIQNTPMLYLNGTTDPATPLPWALSHFTAQTQNRNKLFISFADAGHSILMDPRWERCSDLIFEKISSHRFSQITENILFIQNGCPPPKKKISDNVQF